MSAPASQLDAPPAAAAPTAGSDGTSARAMSRIVAMSLMALSTLYVLAPVWWLLVSSTKDSSTFLSTAPLWFTPDALTTFASNLRGLLTYNDGIFLRWVLNSALYAGVGSLVATLLAAMCGYALAKYSFRGREVVFNFVLGGVLLPVTALALPLFLLFSKVGLTNTVWSVFLPSIVSPLGVYLARIFAAASVPDELIEAARLDGAGELRIFFTIATRLMAPALITIYLFQFVAIWNDFFLPLIMLRDQSLFSLTLGLYSWNTQISMAPELRTFVIIGAFVSIVPLILVFLSLQRFWSSGLSSGSVK